MTSFPKFSQNYFDASHNPSINTHFRAFYDSEVGFSKKLFYRRFFLKKNRVLPGLKRLLDRTNKRHVFGHLMFKKPWSIKRKIG